MLLFSVVYEVQVNSVPRPSPDNHLLSVAIS